MATRPVKVKDLKRGHSFSVGTGKWAVVQDTEPAGDQIKVTYSIGFAFGRKYPTRTMDPDLVLRVRN